MTTNRLETGHRSPPAGEAAAHAFPTCVRCGDRIGVYEPIWWEQPDGRLEACGVLALRERGVDPLTARLLHLGCLAPDAAPSA